MIRSYIVNRRFLIHKLIYVKWTGSPINQTNKTEPTEIKPQTDRDSGFQIMLINEQIIEYNL